MFISDSLSGRLSGSRSLLKALPLLLLPLLWADGAGAAECSQNSYFLDTQAEVDALGATGCDSVRGDLKIQSSDTTNLDALANLTSVGGDLNIIYNFYLTNLDGLANLTSVGGDLRIYHQFALTNLDGLANLTSVGGFLEVFDNDVLTNLDGLANITSVGRDLYVGGNKVLTNCQGLATVLGWPNGPPDDAIGGDIDVVNNGAGCNSIDEIFGSVSEPTKPSIISTDSGDGEIILEISISDNGGADITRYDASCTDGTNTYIGTSPTSPITVSGLTNDVAYTCTVTATNSVGTSSASSATAPITPEEIASGLPIWLLYQATQ